ncbi:hypothetical protein BDB00DRAFT_863986 [Zychaea mexicana]|uniref:uncharacterized protein n=1 Tax=Zychaea mexicana TaxID=64656 RepID=UPI0022FECF01|nr:uncharacterized protein BDB00DRAFT_866258 [Zychaea mexicana]XP_052972256.1 uncharacterized protein BDB00DRAFT_863986 [Zychaea mexicana]KAI9465955.1 hypothetical protein BDB00DRAFT_866258 [Zychaea mexicana]KAI9468311.1 hypothetical protein BDB00DRAFT_863986 [Zychaea mexicana]
MLVKNYFCWKLPTLLLQKSTFTIDSGKKVNAIRFVVGKYIKQNPQHTTIAVAFFC